jgi:hypothetical protein
MLKSNEWLAFFHNIENKTDLIKMAANFFKSEDRKKQLSVPQKDETWRIPKDEEAISLFKCNHEEADTRLILHACLQDTNVVVVAKPGYRCIRSDGVRILCTKTRTQMVYED